MNEPDDERMLDWLMDLSAGELFMELKHAWSVHKLKELAVLIQEYLRA